MAGDQPEIALYSYFISSCAGRLRLALALKDLDYTYITLNTEAGKQHEEEYAKLNPSKSVPTLIVRRPGGGDNKHDIVLRQSWSAMEYLEETFPDRRALLPKETELRAQIRELAMIIISDTQPVTNTRIAKRLSAEGIDPDGWTRHFFDRGMRAYDETAQHCAGKYSVGDNVTLADVCLLPAIWNVQRAGMPLDPYPTVKRIYESLKDLPDAQRAHWSNQPDTSHE